MYNILGDIMNVREELFKIKTKNTATFILNLFLILTEIR